MINMAIVSGHRDMIAPLIDLGGADPNQVDGDGIVPLYVALFNDDEGSLKVRSGMKMKL